MSQESPTQTVLGLTGPFGSGCSTLAKVLERDFNFHTVCLSDFVKKKWAEENNKENAANAPREELQTTGNNMRFNDGNDILAKKTYKQLVDKGTFESKKLLFDSIRNTSEIEFFRKKFPNFFLIAVDCVQQDRWKRVQEKYNGKFEKFSENDKRDKNEEGVSYGQQVALCVDDADVLIRNDNDRMVRTPIAWEQRLKDKINYYLELFEKCQGRPTEMESNMSIAYCASLMSRCFKRQVGAVIVDEKNRVVSVGYNENPPPLEPCNKEFFDCYREMYVDELMLSLRYCPNCGEKLSDFKYPYYCKKCNHNVYRMVVRDRALSRCSALHAEERSIINANEKGLDNCTMYVTTFPCFNCARKIVEVGISTIVYSESYPDTDSIEMFERASQKGQKINLIPFEGVKARAYFRLFSQWRLNEEERMRKLRVI